MPFPELLLREAPAPASGLSARADVALFVGLVPRRDAPLPHAIRAALEAAGWAGAGSFARPDAQVEALLDMPVAVEGWGAFEELFDWDGRLVEAGDERRIPCPLALAVRSFFAAGGVRAWVVRCGDPLPLLRRGSSAAIAAQNARLLAWAPAAPPPDAAQRVPLIGGLNGLGNEPDPTAPATWRGVGHAWGVEEAAMLLLPDLAELAGGVPRPLPAPPGPPPVPEAFRPCAPPVQDSAPPQQRVRLAFTAPRLDRDGYRLWSQALAQVLRMLATPRGAAHRRDVTLISSLPLPQTARDAAPAEAEAWPLALLDEAGIPAPGVRLRDAAGLGSARLQLGYPWVETDASAALPEGVEAPEGVLAGTIAAGSLRLGAFRSAAGSALPAVHRTLPELGTGALRRGLPDSDAADWLGARLSLVARRVEGFGLLSDATMSADASWRPGGVSRLMGILLRAARTLGQERIFDSSGPALWAELRLELEALLERLRGAGALDGPTPAAAYTVRCDRSTMTQADLDNGRVIATLAFQPAYPVERITVTLALAEAGLALRGRAA
ncbi:phage tail sheath C-terminal domain-containing protein [Falsiroseomonas sp.]|uniref:phage tail sheath C-terminal domain-containing protein n=1 Tax=Falsiroseomonas sp. TaxID=2870721 RepID=UPI00356B6186